AVHPGHGSIVNLGLALHAFGRGFFLERHDKAILANGESNAWSCGTSQGFRQSVVAPAAENRILRAQRAMREFERGSRVVVQSAYQSVIEREWYAHFGQDSLHRFEVFAGVFAEKLGDARQS